ncbi:MAG: DUF4160 domain-containing protein [Elusimicrobia bacterium]|nr:DUF4160 domain-containing protein [Elusimicrobiota bacterium]
MGAISSDRNVKCRDVTPSSSTIVALAKNNGLTPRQLNEIQTIIEDKNHEIKNAWKKHFGR